MNPWPASGLCTRVRAKEASEADLLGQPLDVKRKPFDLDELDNLDSSNVSEVTKNELEENLKNDLKKFTGKK